MNAPARRSAYTVHLGDAVASSTASESRRQLLRLQVVLDMDGPVAAHDIDVCYEVTEATLRSLFGALYEHNILHEGTILKASMVVSGKDCPDQAGVEEVERGKQRCRVHRGAVQALHQHPGDRAGGDAQPWIVGGLAQPGGQGAGDHLDGFDVAEVQRAGGLGQRVHQRLARGFFAPVRAAELAEDLREGESVCPDRGELGRGGEEGVDDRVQQLVGDEQRGLVREIAEEGARRDVGSLGDLLDGPLANTDALDALVDRAVAAARAAQPAWAEALAEIDRLHGPIGLDLGSKTPAEIAVSIVAEIVAVKNGVALMQKKEGSALPEASGVCARS